MRVVFLVDLGDVVTNWTERDKIIEKIALVGRAEIDNVQRLKAICQSECWWDLLDKGQMTDNDFYQKFLAAAGISPNIMPPSRFWPLYSASHLHPVSVVVEFLIKLQKQGHKIIAFSNGDSGSQYVVDVLQIWSLCPEINRLGFIFDEQIISRDIGTKKPGKPIYQTGLEIAKKISGRQNPLIIMIDNMPEYLDPKILDHFGIKGICWNVNDDPFTKLESELRILGVEFTED